MGRQPVGVGADVAARGGVSVPEFSINSDISGRHRFNLDESLRNTSAARRVNVARTKSFAAHRNQLEST